MTREQGIRACGIELVEKLDATLPKYRHLWAWDTMMKSNYHVKTSNQQLAEEEGAPIDAVYRINTGIWQRFESIPSQDTKERVLRAMQEPQS
jgi:hypothetical protein